MTASLRLSRKEVQAKYGPIPDPLWTPEVEAKFFAGLPKASHRHSASLDDEREMLIRDFGTLTLKAKRMSADYVATLGAILGEFADADTLGNECLIPQRDEALGTARAIRTIQSQLLRSGHLVKETRSQGHGFVGAVFVYAPIPSYRHRKASVDYLEETYRSSEGECPYLATPSNLTLAVVPF